MSFGSVTAVDGIDLSVSAGGGIALVGRNGAGKSTTLRVLAGVLPPSSGHAEIAGGTWAVTRRRPRSTPGIARTSVASSREPRPGSTSLSRRVFGG